MCTVRPMECDQRCRPSAFRQPILYSFRSTVGRRGPAACRNWESGFSGRDSPARIGFTSDVSRFTNRAPPPSRESPPLAALPPGADDCPQPYGHSVAVVVLTGGASGVEDVYPGARTADDKVRIRAAEQRASCSFFGLAEG